jgi:hypothetical protein
MGLHCFRKAMYTGFHLDETSFLSFFIISLLCHKKSYVTDHLIKMKLTLKVALARFGNGKSGWYMLYKSYWLYLYFYDPLQIINFNSLNIQVCHIILCHIIFLHWKIFPKIEGAWHITMCHIIFLHWKIILKKQENHLMSPFSIEN